MQQTTSRAKKGSEKKTGMGICASARYRLFEGGWKSICPPPLSPGDKSILAPVFPCVTVQRKSFTSAVKLRQESITLTQDPEQTWSHVLPRTDLTNRFLVIECASKDRRITRHIVADVTKVRPWRIYLFDKHPDFIRMKESGILSNSPEALAALKQGSELAEVVIDDQTDDSEYSQVLPDDGMSHAATKSGMSTTDIFTFDKHPQLYLKAKNFLKLKQGGLMKLIEAELTINRSNTVIHVLSRAVFKCGTFCCCIAQALNRKSICRIIPIFSLSGLLSK